MAVNYKLRRFSNPATLKAISPALLVQFLEPFRKSPTLAGIDLDVAAGIDYEALVTVLMSPDESVPDALLDALFFVDEMSTEENFEDLVREAQRSGLELRERDDLTPADVALTIWIEQPELLERLHAEQFLVRPKSFESFQCMSQTPPVLTEVPFVKHARLQEELNRWFETRKRGRGTRVFPFVKEDGVWFLVRHGEPYKREGTLKDGESSSVYYRPEKFDVLIYNQQLGELAIHAGTKAIKRAYGRFFGKHLFNDEHCFNTDIVAERYTLKPIIEVGPTCIACADVEGIEKVHLAELQFRHDSHQYHVEVHKADDVFTALEHAARTIPPAAVLLRASFKVKFKGAVRPRTVVIRPPNVAIFDRESDAQLLNKWLTYRGFMPPVAPAWETQYAANADAALEIH